MSHHSQAKSTHLDYITAFAVIAFFVFCCAIVLGPVRLLQRVQDEARSEHVRMLMAALVQLESTDPERYEELVAQLEQQGDLRVMIGTGDCSGSHGKGCQEFVTADTCLPIRDYVSRELLPELPVDPQEQRFSEELPGYYLRVTHGQLEVGSCGAVTREVELRH